MLSPRTRGATLRRSRPEDDLRDAALQELKLFRMDWDQAPKERASCTSRRGGAHIGLMKGFVGPFCFRNRVEGPSP